jgi:hypothetical protein
MPVMDTNEKDREQAAGCRKVGPYLYELDVE